MSDQPSEFSRLLDADNAPQSPESLDRHILAYARARAPRKMIRNTWMPALATASVVCIAVLIGIRQAPQTAPDARIIATEAQQRFYDGAAQLIDERAAQPTEERAAQPTEESAAQPGDEAAVREAVVDERQRRSAASAGDAAESADDSAGQTQTTAQQKRRSIVGEVAPASSLAEFESTLLAKPAAADAEGIDAALLELRDLLRAGKQRQAEDGYRALKTRCPQCALPDTLEQALNNLPH